MIRSIKAKDFKAVPYLEQSLIMSTNNHVVEFSDEKVNVIVGPNGSGKSALLNALSLYTLSSLTGKSLLHDDYTCMFSDFWTRKYNTYGECYFLTGLDVDSDIPAAMYYRPNHVPGNRDFVAEALMCGYSSEAKEFSQKTKNKSSGQQCSALLSKMIDVISGVSTVPDYTKSSSFRFDPERASNKAYADMNAKEMVLFDKYETKRDKNAKPVILMDEPEQSLDALSELKLWNKIGENDCGRQQIIVATHSLYPILNKDKFNIIESSPGYVSEVLGSM